MEPQRMPSALIRSRNMSSHPQGPLGSFSHEVGLRAAHREVAGRGDGIAQTAATVKAHWGRAFVK